MHADRFEVLSDAWGYANYHEYAFGSKIDPEGNIYVALGLSYSYHSRALFRGWILKVAPDGETVPIASGLRSPAGIGPNEHGAMMLIESQGPWNSSNSLKAVSEGSFHGHPISFNWYPYAPNLGDAPTQPESGGRIITERERVPRRGLDDRTGARRSLDGVRRVAPRSARQLQEQLRLPFAGRPRRCS